MRPEIERRREQTYEEILDEIRVGFRADALEADRFSDYVSLAERLEDELGWIRKAAEATRCVVRRARKAADRYEARFGERWSYLDEKATYYERRLASERAHRDEIRDGLRAVNAHIYGRRTR